MANPRSVYQLKVTLKGTKPPIWRRVVVPENITLYRLHDILQIVMGWTDSHLHMFEIAGQIYGDPEDDEYGDLGTKSEARYRLLQLGLRAQARFSYEYDFGDSWDHTILVEKVLPAEKGTHYPICLAGKRACPPEDVGGVWGYDDFLRAIADRTHQEHDEYLEWVGGSFDPDAFNLNEINQALQATKSARREKAAFPTMEDDLLQPEPDEKALMERLVAWAQGLSQSQIQKFDALPLRRDVLSLLDYLSKNRTVGTQATGNLPLKAVRAICAQFVKPPALETSIGDYTFKVRSEQEVWPLVYVHALAFNAGLITGGQGRAWKVTSNGEKFTELIPPVQVFFLFFGWLVQVDWTIAFSYSGLSDGLPDEFEEKALDCLDELPVGEKVSYAAFADRLIAQSGLSWPSKDQTLAKPILHSAIQRMVIDPLAEFGLLEREFVSEPISKHEFKTLAYIRWLPEGQGILELLK
jgi:hypothetical protein